MCKMNSMETHTVRLTGLSSLCTPLSNFGWAIISNGFFSLFVNCSHAFTYARFLFFYIKLNMNEQSIKLRFLFVVSCLFAFNGVYFSCCPHFSKWTHKWNNTRMKSKKSLNKRKVDCTEASPTATEMCGSNRKRKLWRKRKVAWNTLQCRQRGFHLEIIPTPPTPNETKTRENEREKKKPSQKLSRSRTLSKAMTTHPKC